MPEPGAGEDRAEWLDRCMGDPEAVADFPDPDQRFAVCVSKWEERSEQPVEQKSLSIEIKSVDEDGTIEGYGAVFGNEDSYGDIIEPGAFRESLAMRRPKMLWQHNMNEVIGAWDEYREDAKGLWMKGKLALGVRRGSEARELIKMGAIDGLSIGYITRDYAMDGTIRRLKRVDLYETSIVTEPANSMALVAGVKSADVRGIEAAFRQMGFSRSEAKAMASAAWKRRGDVLRDAGVTVPEADQREVDELKALLTETLKSIGGSCG